MGDLTRKQQSDQDTLRALESIEKVKPTESATAVARSFIGEVPDASKAQK
jgi:hypothetical protein